MTSNPEPDPLAEDLQAFPALDQYWEALRLGQRIKPPEDSACAAELAADFDTLQMLHVAREVEEQDSILEEVSTVDYDSREPPTASYPAREETHTRGQLPLGTRLGEYTIESLLERGGR
jgi:hypothetical protein